MSVSLTLHPRFALHLNGADVQFKNRKAQALLVYLALTGKPQSRTHLATLLWGDRFENQARSSLRQALYALRKAVGDGVVLGDDELSLDMEVLDIQAGTAGGLLEGFRSGGDAFDSWLDSERQRQRQQAALEMFDLARKQEQAGEPEASLATIREAIVLEPLDEQIARFEIALLAGLGRRTEALTRYADFARLIGQEFDARPEPETDALVERIRLDDGPASGPDAMAKRPAFDPAGSFNILIAPFEDLGGGDTAAFLARDIPTQIVHLVSRGVLMVNLLPEVRDGDNEKTPLQRAAEAEAVWLLSGSVRQIGSRVRITLTGTDVLTGNVAATDAALIPEDEAFDYLDSVGDLVSSLWRTRYVKLARYDQMVIDRLKLIKDQPDQFYAIVEDTFYQAFYTNYSRVSIAHLETVADFALAQYPKLAEYHAVKGWAHFSYTDLLDAKTRYEGCKTAKSIFEHALLLQPNHPVSWVGLASAGCWLGKHETTEVLLKKSKLSPTAVPIVDVIRGNSAMFSGRTDEAIEILERVIEKGAGLAALGNWYATLGLAQFNKGSYETALSSANIALEFSSEYWLSYLVKMAALGRMGRVGQARETVAAYHVEYPGANVQELDFLPFTEDLAKTNFLDALKDAGLPE